MGLFSPSIGAWILPKSLRWSGIYFLGGVCSFLEIALFWYTSFSSLLGSVHEIDANDNFGNVSSWSKYELYAIVISFLLLFAFHPLYYSSLRTCLHIYVLEANFSCYHRHIVAGLPWCSMLIFSFPLSQTYRWRYNMEHYYSMSH